MYYRYAEKLKTIINKEVDRKKYEKALAAISAYAQISYHWNQFYCDDQIEETLMDISNVCFPKCKEYYAQKKMVLFYDGFGLDVRGLAIIYIKALKELGYKILYVTTAEKKGKQEHLIKLFSETEDVVKHINMCDTHLNHARELDSLFEEYQPEIAFLYTLPYDVASVIVFHKYADQCERYQINLTDHAFWLGKCAFDKCIEFREYGAGVSIHKRRIAEKDVCILPYYPYVDREIEFQGFDFDCTGKKIVFSGGALYKTFGNEGKYYKMIAAVLERNDDAIFLYAGSGDDTQLKQLGNRYIGRVYHINERKDLYALLTKVRVYINTYPLIGGLMTQYAAIAGTVPLILNDTHKTDNDGILINQKEIGVEFEEMDALVEEATRLINDNAYHQVRAEVMKKAVINEQDYRVGLSQILNHKEENVCVEDPDTADFLKTYRERFGKKHIEEAIAKRINKSLAREFPKLFITRVIHMVTKSIR